MFQIVYKPTQKTFFQKLSASVLVLVLSLSLVFPPTFSYAELLNLPDPGTTVSFSKGYQPAVITGVVVSSEDPLLFDFIIDRGDSGLTGAALEEETKKLVKYFLAALTIPEEEVWVNLSPYERELMIPFALGITEMGQDMLAQDYLLKQMTASLTHPDSEIGKKFWKQVYDKAYKLYGTTEIPINTFSKVWIVPEDAVVLEKDGTAYVVDNTLKVMLEEDYLAIEKNLNNTDIGTDQLTKERVEYINNLSADIVNEVILPELSKEINEGKNFSLVRQVYNSVILAIWYKDRLKETLLGRIYVDRNKVSGVDVADKTIKEKIYMQYMDALRQGVYNFIKEDVDPSNQSTLQRRYFSGGIEFAIDVNKTSSPILLGQKAQSNWKEISSGITTNEKAFDNVERYVRARVGLNTTQPILTNTQHVAKVVLPSLSFSAVSAAIDNSNNIPEDRKILLKKEFMAASEQAKRTGKPIEPSQLSELRKEIELGGVNGLTENLTGVLPTVSTEVAASQVDFAKSVVPNLAVPVMNQMIDQANLQENERVVLKSEFKQASDIALAENKPVRISSIPQIANAIENVESGLAVELARVLPTQRPDILQNQVNVATKVLPNISSAVVDRAIQQSTLPEAQKTEIRQEYSSAVQQAQTTGQPLNIASVPKLMASISKPETGVALEISSVVPASSPVVQAEQVNVAKQILPNVNPAIVSRAIEVSALPQTQKAEISREFSSAVQQAQTSGQPLNLTNVPQLARAIEQPESGIAAGISRVVPTSSPVVQAEQVNIAKQILPSVSPAVVSRAIEASTLPQTQKEAITQEFSSAVQQAQTSGQPLNLTNVPQLARAIEQPESGIAAGISRVIPTSSPVVQTEQVNIAKQILPSVSPAVVSRAIEASTLPQTQKEAITQEFSSAVQQAQRSGQPLNLTNVPQLARAIEQPESGIAAGISRVIPTSSPVVQTEQVNIAKQILPSVSPAVVSRAIEASALPQTQKEAITQEFSSAVQQAQRSGQPLNLTNVPQLARAIEQPESGIAAGISRVVPTSSPVVQAEQVNIAKQILPSVSPAVVSRAIEASALPQTQKEAITQEFSSAVQQAQRSGLPLNLTNVPQLARAIEQPESGIAAGISRVVPTSSPVVQAEQVNIAKQILPSVSPAVVSRAIEASALPQTQKEAITQEFSSAVQQAQTSGQPLNLTNVPQLARAIEQPESGIAAGISRVIPTSSPVVQTEQVNIAKQILPSVSPAVVSRAIEASALPQTQKEAITQEFSSAVQQAQTSGLPLNLTSVPQLARAIEQPESGIAAGISRVIPTSSPMVQNSQASLAKQILPSVSPAVVSRAIEASALPQTQKEAITQEFSSAVQQAQTSGQPLNLTSVPQLARAIEQPESGIAAGISRVIPTSSPVVQTEQVSLAKQILPNVSPAVVSRAIEASALPQTQKEAITQEFSSAVQQAQASGQPLNLTSVPQLARAIEQPESGIAAGISRVIPTSSPVVQTEQVSLAKQVLSSVSPVVVSRAIEASTLPQTQKEAITQEFSSAVQQAQTSGLPLNLTSVPQLARAIEQPESGIAAGISRVIPTSSPVVQTEQVSLAKQILPNVSPAVVSRAIEVSALPQTQKEAITQEFSSAVQQAQASGQPLNVANLPKLSNALDNPVTGLATGISRQIPKVNQELQTPSGQITVAKQVLSTVSTAVIQRAIQSANLPENQRAEITQEFSSAVQQAQTSGQPLNVASVPRLIEAIEQSTTGIASEISRVVPTSSPVVQAEQVNIAKQILPSVSTATVSRAIEASALPQTQKEAITQEFSSAVQQAQMSGQPLNLASIPQLTRAIEQPESGIAAGISRNIPTSSPVVQTEQVNIAKQILPSVSPATVSRAIETSSLPQTQKEAITQEFSSAVQQAQTSGQPLNMASVPRLVAAIERPETGIASGISRNIPTSSPVVQAEQVNIAKQILPSVSPALVSRAIETSTLPQTQKAEINQEFSSAVQQAQTSGQPLNMTSVPRLVAAIERPETGIASGISRNIPTSSPVVQTEQVNIAKQILPSVSPALVSRAIETSTLPQTQKAEINQEFSSAVQQAQTSGQPLNMASVPRLVAAIERPETGIASGISRVVPTSSPIVQGEQVNIAKQILPNVSPALVSRAIETSTLPQTQKAEINQEFSSAVQQAQTSGQPLNMASVPRLVAAIERPETGLASGISRVVPTSSPVGQAEQVNIAKQILPNVSPALVSRAIETSALPQTQKAEINQEFSSAVQQAQTSGQPLNMASMPKLVAAIERPETGIASGISRNIPTSSPVVQAEQVNIAKQILPNVSPALVSRTIETSALPQTQKAEINQEFSSAVQQAQTSGQPLNMASIPKLVAAIERPETGIASGISRNIPTSSPVGQAEQVNIAKQILPNVSPALVSRAIETSALPQTQKAEINQEFSSAVQQAQTSGQPLNMASMPRLVAAIERPETGIASGISRVVPTSSPIVQGEQVNIAKQILPSVSPAIVSQAIETSSLPQTQKAEINQEFSSAVQQAQTSGQPLNMASMPKLVAAIERPETGIASGISRVVPTSSPVVQAEQVNIAKQILPSMSPSLVSRAIETSALPQTQKAEINQEFSSAVQQAQTSGQPLNMASMPKLVAAIERPETGIASGISRVVPTSSPVVQAEQVNIAKQILPSVSPALVSRAIETSALPQTQKAEINQEFSSAVQQAQTSGQPLNMASMPKLVAAIERPETGIASGISQSIPSSSPLVVSERLKITKEMVPNVSPTVISNAIELAEIPESARNELRQEFNTVSRQAINQGKSIELKNLPKLAAAIENPNTRIADTIMRTIPATPSLETQTMQIESVKALLPQLSAPIVSSAISDSNLSNSQKVDLIGKFTVASNLAEKSGRFVDITSMPELVAAIERPDTGLAMELSRSVPTKLESAANKQNLKVSTLSNIANQTRELDALFRKDTTISSQERQELIREVQTLKQSGGLTDIRQFRSQASPELLARVTKPPIGPELERVGGINLNAKLFDFRINKEGKGVQIPIALKDGQEINFGGLEPFVIEVVPATPDSVPFNESSTDTAGKDDPLRISRN